MKSSTATFAGDSARWSAEELHWMWPANLARTTVTRHCRPPFASVSQPLPPPGCIVSVYCVSCIHSLSHYGTFATTHISLSLCPSSFFPNSPTERRPSCLPGWPCSRPSVSDWMREPDDRPTGGVVPVGVMACRCCTTGQFEPFQTLRWVARAVTITHWCLSSDWLPVTGTVVIAVVDKKRTNGLNWTLVVGHFLRDRQVNVVSILRVTCTQTDDDVPCLSSETLQSNSWSASILLGNIEYHFNNKLFNCSSPCR